MMSVSSIRGFAGMTPCIGCQKKGITTPVYNHGLRGRKTSYCDQCKKERLQESVRRSKLRAKMRAEREKAKREE